MCGLRPTNGAPSSPCRRRCASKRPSGAPRCATRRYRRGGPAEGRRVQRGTTASVAKDLSDSSIAVSSGSTWSTGVSPRLRTLGVKEAAGRSVAGQERQVNRRGCPFGDGLISAMAVEVGGGEAGIGRIDLDARVLQFGGELDGQHIQRRFRAVVPDQFHAREFRGRVVV